jgi:hypothetical protein
MLVFVKIRGFWRFPVLNNDELDFATQALLNQSEALARINLPRLNLDITGGLD